MNEDGVFRGSEKGFDFEVLLDPFEEDFDLPSCFVNVCDGAGGEFEVVGDKDEIFVLLFVEDLDATQRFWIKVSCLSAGQHYGLICDDVFIFGNFMLSDNEIIEVFLGASDEPDVLFVE